MTEVKGGNNLSRQYAVCAGTLCFEKVGVRPSKTWHNRGKIDDSLFVRPPAYDKTLFHELTKAHVRIEIRLTKYGTERSGARCADWSSTE